MPPPHAEEALHFDPPHPATGAASANATGGGSWGPYSSAGDFGANMAVILAAVFCTVLLALSLGAAVRLLLRHHQSRHRRPSEDEPEKPAPPAAPTMLFSAAGTQLVGTGAAECAICLAEFAEGDAVQALPACNHGFHVRCVERWLAASSSCPTCRRPCSEAGAAGKGGKGERAGEQDQVQVQILVERALSRAAILQAAALSSNDSSPACV